MKKIKLSVMAAALICSHVHAQNAALPEPSTGSLANYVNTAVSAATGVPNIGFPIYQLETSNKDFPVSISLSYHVYNAKPNIPASDVGQGWSLFTSGVITRQTTSDVDETVNVNDINEEQADVFYYVIPGHSGKFKILKDQATGNLAVQNITGEKLKIDYERDLSTSKFVIKSFTITDDRGFKYFFEEYNIGITKVTVNYKTSFHLTKVEDPNGQLVVSYAYDKNIKYKGTSTIKKYQSCKINTIATNKGKIKFNYQYEPLIEQYDAMETDPYMLNSITLTDPGDHLLSKYQFVYIGAVYLADIVSQNNEMVGVVKPRRALTALQKFDKNLSLNEETIFDYDQEGSTTQYGYYPDTRYGNFLCTQNQTLSPKKYTMGTLSKITFPTKGYVMYDFEANTMYVNRNTSGTTYDDWETHYYAMTSQIPFETNTSRLYNLTTTGPYDTYIFVGAMDIYPTTDNHGTPIPFSYQITNSANQVISPISCSSEKIFRVTPGNYKVRINGGGNGIISQYTMKPIPGPYKNEAPVMAGARVKMIRSFDADGTPVKTKKYEYQSFSDVLSSSGQGFSGESALGLNSPYDSFILYKNVKETEISSTGNNGYIKYYFKTPDDYATPAVSGYYPYYNFTSAGILEKKETYNSQDQKTESSDYEYTFQEIPGTSEINLYMGTTRPSWLQHMKETDTSFLEGGTFSTVKETTYSPHNFQEILTKSTAPDGETSETVTHYAQEMGNTRFLTSNMISVPLQVETKSNGSLIAKATTFYNSTSHLYPTSVESTDLNQTAETKLYFDLYDSKGNLVQTTDRSGNSVTTLWGYHQTLPIAQVTGAKYSDIASAPAVAAAIAASDADADDPSHEAALLTALENLRTAPQLQDYPVSASTFDPLIGVTHTISPNGIRQSYEYDASGKLARVKNSEGKVLTENQYHYKH